MRVRVRTSGIIRLLILCGLIAELVLAPLAQAGPSRAFAAHNSALSRPPLDTTTTTTATTTTATTATATTTATVTTAEAPSRPPR